MPHRRLTFLLCTLILIAAGCRDSSNLAHVQAVTGDVAVEISYVNTYGISTDSLWAFTDNIEYGETLSEILGALGVKAQTIFKLKQAAAGVFNVRSLKAGEPYRVYRSSVPDGEVQYVVYEPGPVEYVVFDLTDSVGVSVDRRPVKTVKRAVAGIITSSLYETFQAADAPIMLALKLANVYAWQVDFYGIQRGDRFKVIYEQKLVDGEPVGVGNIIGAYFRHRGDDYYAVRFKQGDVVDYFDIEGHSLRKAFLKAPLEFSRISSPYSGRRFHPVLGRYEAHLGTDYAAPRGTPIHATGDGTVVVAGYDRYNGRWVKIRHNSVYSTGYLHMSDIADGIHPGVHVKQGEVIGYVGATGLATGPHLHYHFWKNGQAVDHREVEMPPSKPVKEAYREEFEARKEVVLAALQQLSYPENRRLEGALALAL